MEWWGRTCGTLKGLDKRGFDSFIIATAWQLWKQRNARVFGRSGTLDVFGVTEAIFHELVTWKQAGATGVEHVVE